MTRALSSIVAAALLAGCTGPGAPAARRAGGPPPYEVPADPRDGETDGTQGGDLGPIPVTQADPVRGDRNAPVTIVEFAEFQCPFCQRASATMDQIQREYGPTKVRIVWKHFPLSFHRHARRAAEIGAALHERGGDDWFFRYHDLVFASRGDIDDEALLAAASRAGAAQGEVDRVLRRGTASAKVDADLELAQTLGVTGVPAFYINGTFIGGAQPIEKFRAVVDAELARASALRAQGTPPAKLYATLTTKGFVPPKPEAPAAPVEDRTSYRVPVDGSPVRGKATALVTIVEFADYQCPFCYRVEPTLRDLRARYGDQIRIVWKDQPLPFHKRAPHAAELAREARAQRGDGAFWTVHDALLAQKGALEDDDLSGVAKTAGIDVRAAMRAVERGKHEEGIENDTDLADDVGASGTPTFFVNGRKLVGAKPIESFVALIDEQLVAARALVARGVAPAKVYDTLQQDASGGMPEKVVVPAPTRANPSRGPANAKIVVQMWSDFECPFCKRVEPTIKDLEAAFPGQIRVVWRNLPLPFHKHASIAAEAAMEAYAQKGSSGFWRMHDLIMKGGSIDRAALEQDASTLGLDMSRFRAALDQGTHRAQIEADMKIAEQAGIHGTPGFTINGYKVSGAESLAKFKKVVRLALAESK
jgi:protein-disulfide isomerase